HPRPRPRLPWRAGIRRRAGPLAHRRDEGGPAGGDRLRVPPAPDASDRGAGEPGQLRLRRDAGEPGLRLRGRAQGLRLLEGPLLRPADVLATVPCRAARRALTIVAKISRAAFDD